MPSRKDPRSQKSRACTLGGIPERTYFEMWARGRQGWYSIRPIEAGGLFLLSIGVKVIEQDAEVPTHRERVSVEIDVDPRKRSVGKTVLVADDNAAIRKMLAGAFLSDGFKTCGEAGNGQEALEVAKLLQPDVITLDLAMPVMNGLKAASELRKLFPKTPIILFTLYGESVLRIDADRAGVSVVLGKTTPLATLVDKAHELMKEPE
jgi:two-component system, chemotaxis family, chemotaxis protein CheY